jgi:hypothetical protein
VTGTNGSVAPTGSTYRGPAVARCSDVGTDCEVPEAITDDFHS